MNDELIDQIVKRYKLQPITRWSQVQEGYLSQNFVLHTTEQPYFLKQYPFDKAARVANAHKAKFFFAAGGIPIVLPIRDQQGDTFFCFADNYFSLFPFIHGRRSHRGHLSTTALTSMGETLARLHLLSKRPDAPKLRITLEAWDSAALIEQATEILQMIAHKQRRDAFDDLAATVLNLKMAIVRQNQRSLSDFGVACNHLIHGDYHEANLFFDEQDHVLAVFDLENARRDSRVLELVRSIDFTCFSDGTQGGRAFERHNFQAAQRYLEAYQAHYPLDPDELRNAFMARYIGSAHSLWIEQEHYLYQNDRVDGFLSGTLQYLQYFSANMTQFLARILA